MTKRRFAFFVESGHGRAVRWISEHGDTDFESIILKACTVDQRFDGQTNEGRGWYLSELLTATGRPEHYLEIVLDRLRRPIRRRNYDQVLELLTELAQRGSTRAADAIQSRWKADLSKFDKYGRKTCCSECFIALGGFRAYREVLLWIKKTAQRRSEVDHSLWGMHYLADGSRWKKRATQFRATLIAKDPRFAAFAGFPELDKPVPPSVKSELALEERIRGGNFVDLRKSTATDQALALKLLDEDLEFRALSILLKSLERACLSVNVDQVRRFIDRYDPAKEVPSPHASEELRLLRASIRLLRHSTDPAVRPLALEVIENQALKWEGMDLLRACFQSGDEALVLRLLKKAKSGDEFHGGAMTAWELSDLYPQSDWSDTLWFLYANQTCTLCRNSLVKTMTKRRLLTDENVKDLAFDADPGTRLLARRWLR